MSVLNPSTYLDLVQRSIMDCQVAGDGPTTTVATSGQNQDFCNWVNAAWIEIQSKYTDWAFLMVSPGVAFATVAGQAFYTPTQAGVTAGVVSSWRRHTFRNYQTSVGQSSETFMEYIPWDQWRDGYQFGALRTAQVRPYVYTIDPNLRLGIQTPLAGYTITGDYYAAPIALSADADIPAIPSQYIMAIVYRTMMFYGAIESAPEVYSTGEKEFNKLMGRLEKTRLPEVLGPGALA